MECRELFGGGDRSRSLIKMDYNQSVLGRTGQTWKLRLMPICVILGSSLIVIAAWFNQTLPVNYYNAMLLVGIATNVASLLVPILSIICPRCGSHWLRTILRKPVGLWYRLMMELVRCPVCGFPSHDRRAS